MKKKIAIVLVLVFSQPVLAEYQAGWTTEQIHIIADDCTNDLLNGARTGYAKRAQQVGNDNPKPFPEDAMEESLADLCTCTTKLAADNLMLDDFNQSREYYQSMLAQKAFLGEVCPVTGILKEITRDTQ